jgi:DNA (cytosine-5)-methyltransferase 1
MTYPVIDLFAGPGGLGEGFSAFEKSTGRRPFSNVLSVEKDEAAHRTLLLRSFYRQFEPTDVPEDYLSYLQGDITRDALFNAHKREANAAMREAVCLELGVSPYAEVRELISQRLKDSSKWVLVGGPPCQAYSLAGRSRMRTTRPDFEKDERHFLYVEYLKILADHMPPIFVMENVKGLLSATHKGDRIVEKIFADLRNPSKAVKGRSSGRGYKLFSLSQRVRPEHLEPSDFIIKAEKYGIPQARHRLLILGIRDDLDITPDILTEEIGCNADIQRAVLLAGNNVDEAWHRNLGD